MRPHFLLLLTLLGPGSTLQLRQKGDKAAPAPLSVRGRRQATLEDEYDDENYTEPATDPPETLLSHTRGVAAGPELPTPVSTLGQRAPEPATVEATTGHSAGLGAGGTAAEEPGTERATPSMQVTAKLATQLTSVIAPTTGPPATEGPLTVEAAVTEDLSTEPASTPPAATKVETIAPVATKAETTPPGSTEAKTTPLEVTEAKTTPPEVTEAKTTPLEVTEAKTTPPEVTEAKTTPPEVTEAKTTPPEVTEAETTPPSTTEAPSVKSVVIEAVSTEPFTVKSLSTETTAAAATFLVTYKGAMVTLSNWKSSEVVLAGSSVAPSPTGASDLIPVKQCLLAILVLALVATVFLVCTVVLAVRLSRKTHTYPVRSYSPTEMVCISALLPDAGEGAPGTANGSLPKGQGRKAEAGEDHEGDDLTLHSFLP